MNRSRNKILSLRKTKSLANKTKHWRIIALTIYHSLGKYHKSSAYPTVKLCVNKRTGRYSIHFEWFDFEMFVSLSDEKKKGTFEINIIHSPGAFAQAFNQEDEYTQIYTSDLDTVMNLIARTLEEDFYSEDYQLYLSTFSTDDTVVYDYFCRTGM